MNDNTCVCCGAQIPEGRQICPICEKEENKMQNRFDAIKNPRKRDRDFLTEIIAQICDYAVDNKMNTNDTIVTIANNILTIAKLANFDNWDRREEK